MFDTELFINEVSIRPPLWDLKLKDYSNRDLKYKLWIEVARIVLSNWEQMTNEEKNKEVKGAPPVPNTGMSSKGQDRVSSN
ncbi:hypothetical protein J6590_084003 [Homalodisca vitripennis]|nr:hypothetical protein J6590_084003 [Homalodisca vitripennis]